MTDWLSLTTEEFSRARIAVLPGRGGRAARAASAGRRRYLHRARRIWRACARCCRRIHRSCSCRCRQVGASDEHRAFRGTLTLSPETALRAFIEIGESVHRAGINKLVIINSHGGNIALIDLAARQLRVRHGMLAVHTSWGRFGYPDGLFSEAERTHGIHGGDIETSIMLAAYPDLVRREKIANFRSGDLRDGARLRAFARGFPGRASAG